MFATVSEWAHRVRTAPHTHQAVPDVPMSQCGGTALPMSETSLSGDPEANMG